MTRETYGAIAGTMASVVGTATQTNDVLQTISIILTIVGTLITIMMAVLNWWRNSKKDGKITEEEIQEGVDVVKDGVDAIKDILEKGKKEKTQNDIQRENRIDQGENPVQDRTGFDSGGD